MLRVGAIDTAAAGLVPVLLHDFRRHCPQATVQLVEDKTIRLLPRLLSGRLDLAFVRPPENVDKRIEFLMLFHETPVVAVPSRHKLASRSRLSIETLADQPLIVPDRSSRPHSHDLTIKLFGQAGLRPNISQVAEEKQTIVNLVAAKSAWPSFRDGRRAWRSQAYASCRWWRNRPRPPNTPACRCLAAGIARSVSGRNAGSSAIALGPLCGEGLMHDGLAWPGCYHASTQARFLPSRLAGGGIARRPATIHLRVSAGSITSSTS